MMNGYTKNTKPVPAICTQCGGQNEVDPSQEKVVCNYCGTSFFVEKTIQNNNVQNTKFEHAESWNIKKPGAVESVLNFVEKQQDKKQQKIDEEKRRLEEEKRKQKERDKEIINQLFNKQYRKRNLVILGAFSVVILMCSCLGILYSLGRSSEEPDTIVKINIPASSSDFEGENYQDVVAKLENAGFTNIQTKLIDDLVFGWFTKDGEVEEVSVDGYTSFSTSSSFPEDVPIVVTYHTFPANEEEVAAETSTPEPTIKAETSTPEPTIKAEPTESSTPKSTIEAKPTEKAQSTEETQPSAKEEIITLDNNEEFAAVLNAKDPGDQIIKDFARKYEGRTIEFDGNIAFMSLHGNFTTRYDILILPWDYSLTTMSGPNFQFKDVNIVFDLNLIGDNIPDYIGIGDNLHIVAKILDYNETQQLFFLDPISTEVR
jgi:hypothetical protein